MSKVTITPELKRDLKKYGELMCVGMATFVRDELDIVALSTIAAFYSSYEPSSYVRQGGLTNGIHKKYYSNGHGSIVRGGVMLTSDKISGSYNGTIDNVFNSVIEGYHGYTANFLVRNPNATIPPVMAPSPLEIIKNKRDTIVSNIGSYIQHGYNRANTGSYSTLS